MSNVDSGSVTSKSSNKQKFSNLLKDLLGAANRVLGHEKDIGSFDLVLDEKRDLERKLRLKDAELLTKDKEISSKDNEIAGLQSAKDTLFREFQEKFKTWDTGTTKQKGLEVQVAELKQKLRHATERANSTKSELTGLQQELGESRKALEEGEEKLTSVRKELRSKERELTGALTDLELLQEERTALGLEDLNLGDLTTKFSAFAKSCHELAGKFLLTRLPEDVTRDDLWTQLCSSGFAKVAPKSMPMSNSTPSQYLRMATAEKIIAHILYNHIFLDYYLPKSVSAREAVNDVLVRLSRGSPREEAIFRLRLLSAYKHDEQHHLMSVVEATTSEIADTLDPLIASNSRDAFESEFNKLLQEAVKLWRLVQRSTVRAWVDMDPDQDWGKYRDYDTAMGSNADKAVHILSNPTEPLFPRVFIGGDVVCQGYALWSDQNTVVAAGIEYSQLKSPNSTHVRTGSGRGGLMSRGGDGRRPSLSGSTTIGGRAGNTPRNQSYVDHLSSREAGRQKPQEANNRAF